MDNTVKEKQEDKKELYKIRIKTPDTGYEPFPVSIINRSTYEALTFDPSIGKTATISYSLTKAGSVRLRIVKRENPGLVLLTLQDWTQQEFGRHEVKWDGRDASGNIIDNKKVLILFDVKEQTFGGKHQDHDAQGCYDPKLIIKTTPKLTQNIKGALEVRISLSGGSDKLRGDSGCEVKYFIDYTLSKREVFQNIQDKFYFRLDTTEFSNGEHFITVNVNDLNDHIGTASLKITVEN